MLHGDRQVGPHALVGADRSSAPPAPTRRTSGCCRSESAPGTSPAARCCARTPRHACRDRGRCLNFDRTVHGARTILAAAAGPKRINLRSGRSRSGLRAAHAPQRSGRTPLPFAKAPIRVTFTPAARDAASRRVPLARRTRRSRARSRRHRRGHWPTAPASSASTRLASADSGTRSRSIMHRQPRSIGDVAGVSQQAVGDVRRRARDADQARPERRARLRQAIALLERRRLQLAARREQAERGIADRAGHPELVPCPRAVAAQALAARHAPEGRDGHRGRPRRAGRVAAAQHDAEAALVGARGRAQSPRPSVRSSRGSATATVDRRNGVAPPAARSDRQTRSARAATSSGFSSARK